MRAEISGDLNQGQSAQLMSIKFDPSATENIPGSAAYAPGSEDWKTRSPLIIYDYTVEVVTDVIATLFQYYCRDSDETASSNWDPTDVTFLENLKKYRLMPGSITSGEVSGNPVGSVTRMSFRAKSYWSKKHREKRWAIPPIVLSKNKKNMIGISLANVSNYHDARSYYGLITVKRWHKMT